MKKSRTRWFQITLLCFLAFLISTSSSLSAYAEGESPAGMLERAWRNAQEAGSYRFISDINQTLIPRAVASMVGQQESALTLALDGAVVLPDQAYTELQVLNGQLSESVVLLREGDQSYMLQDGEIKPVENPLNLASQTNDMLGYLSAADQVTQLDPPPGHSELKRYSFAINGPRYAEYVRRQAEASLKAEPGAPRGLTLQPIPSLQQLKGQGELWVNQAGLPVRQVLDLEIPEVTSEYMARIRISVDFSSYGEIQTLPHAVQGPDGTWRLEGSLSTDSESQLGAFPGFGARPAQEAASEPSALTSGMPAGLPGGLARLKLPLQVSPTSVILFLIILLAVLFMRCYQRNPRLCYTLFVLILIPIFVLSPLLESAGVVRFMERQVQAAEARTAAMPELLRALGFDASVVTASSEVVSKGAGASASINEAQMTLSALQINNQDDSLSRCGDGADGVDTDGDGLPDQVELCLGTNPYLADTDYDGIPDKVEVDGFELGGKHWDSNPLKPDSNEDGVLDTLEWAAALSDNGQAANADLDGDGIPNLWDDDDDGDGVPDAQDISPFAVTGYTTFANLSTQGSGFNGYQTIEIQVQPEDKAHLRYSTTALDWPQDQKGNIQDLDDWNSREDLRLNPFLLVTTNVAPDANLAAKYGFRSWMDGEKVILMAPLSPVQTGGAVHSFFTKVAYAPGQLADIQWQAQLVWMAEMQVDRYEGRVLKTEPQTVHQYQDSFRITGLEVAKDAGYEAAVLGTPDQTDDLYLFKVLLGLNDTFKTHFTLEGQETGETALGEIAQRFAPGSTASLTHTFDVPADHVVMRGPIRYGTMDEGLIRVGSELVPGLLQDENLAKFYNSDWCQDANGERVSCASLIVAYEKSAGTLDLADLGSGDSTTVDPSQMHANLADIPLLTTRGVQMRMYEKGLSGWQMISAARMLELIEQRYVPGYDTAMRSLYPDLQSDDLRFVTYAAYLWATSSSYAPIAIDGQVIVAGLANEAELSANRSLPPEMESEAVTAVNFFGLGSGLFSALVGTGSGNAWSISDLVTYIKEFKKLSYLSAFDGVGAGLFMLSTVTATVMSTLSAVCAAAPDLNMCTRGKEALKIANIAVTSLGVVSQAQTVTSLIIQYATNTLKEISNLVMCVQFVGMAVSVTMVWVSFALTLINGGLNDPITWRMALAIAIVTTIYLLVIFFLNFIPIVGQIITAILALIDAIFSLISLITGQNISIATIILAIFYGAKVLTNVGEAIFGEFTTSLSDPEGGLVGGNTLMLSAPFQGTIYKEDKDSDGKLRNPNEVKGTDDDLRKSSVKGQLTWEYPYYKPEELDAIFPGQDKSDQVDCQIVEGVMYCSNTAALGFALTPRINGLVPVAASTNYTIVWAETGGSGSWRWSTKTWEGTIPEYADLIKPDFMYLDILPLTVTELWNWSALTNHDPDGDGLMNEQEAILGTSPYNWDTDGDGLSDLYEWQSSGDDGSDPLKWDTDGDGLSDALERRLGTLVNVADSDGDGLSDGEEVRRSEGGVMVGGWQVTMPDGATFWVSSDPLQADADGDGLNDAEEKANGLSPYAANQPVPSLSMSVSPARGVPGGRVGAYWLPEETVQIDIRLSNGSPEAVTTSLILDLPAWLTDVQVGAMQGDRTPDLSINGGQLSWSFSGANALQTYEIVSTTIHARAASASGSGEVVLSLPFGSLQLRKTFSAVLDGDNPTLAILAPSGGEFLRGTHYVIGGLASDPTTWIVEQSLSIGQGSEPNYQAIPASQGAWAYAWELPTTDGIYNIQARAADVMGHASTAGPVSVIVDNTPPSVSLVHEMLNGHVRLSGTATDNLAGIHWVQVSLDGQPWRSVAFEDSAWSFDWTLGQGAQGRHQVWVRAFDNAGNESAPESAEIIVDSVAPSSIVNSGADPDQPPVFKPDSSFTISGVADESGHLPQPASPAGLASGMEVFSDSTVWLGLSTIHDNDGGVLAAWIGDFNADRLSDLAVGLPGPEGDGGFVSVLYGRAGGWPVTPDLEMLAKSPMRFNGTLGARLGSLLAAAGDANGDNMDDLLIGERGSNRAFLIFGNPRPLGEITLEAGLNAYRVLLQTPDTITGLAAAGDVNGDGAGDLLIQTGEKAYLVLGRTGPWPETLNVAAEAATEFNGINGALGVGDVDGDQLAEWVTLAGGTITLYGWNTSAAAPVLIRSFATADGDPRAAALGFVNTDGYADWIYSDGASRILVYGSGSATHTFSSYDGFFAAPGDVNGDGWADILLSNAAGLASLVGQPSGGAPSVLATIAGVGGAANAPYETGADLNSDGSADLLLIPSQTAAQASGFDAPDFSSGYISPQSLPVGTSTASFSQTTAPSIEQDSQLLALRTGELSPSMRNTSILSSYTLSTTTQNTILLAGQSDTRYVDDDPGGCDGNTPCYQTILQAVSASDGGGDVIIVYPGVYTSFNVPAGSSFDQLTVQGVNADAVFVEGAGTYAIQVGADGVRLSNLTVRNATTGIILNDGAGEPTQAGGSETYIDHVVAHSVQTPIRMSQGAALKLSDSTLVGDGANPIVALNTSSGIHFWSDDRTAPDPIGSSGSLITAGGALYALPGSGNSKIYRTTAGSTGALGSWTQPFNLQHALPTNTGTAPTLQGTNLLVGGATTISQLHSNFTWPNLGGKANGVIEALAIHPTTGDIYAGGRFTIIGGIGATYIARWNGTSWSSLGAGAENGTNGPVLALTFDGAGNLYLGGEFTKAGSKDAGRVAGWNGSSWFVLGSEGRHVTDPSIILNGVDGPVHAVAYDAVSNKLFIGGQFNRTYEWGSSSAGYNSKPSPNLAAWSPGCIPSQTSVCYQTFPYLNVNGPVNALAMSGSQLYVGGSFSSVGSNPSVSVKNIASYTTTATYNCWSALGPGLNNPVRDIAVNYQGHLYAIQDNSSGEVWKWNGSTWTLPGGYTVDAQALAIDSGGNVYTADNLGKIRIQRGGIGSFEVMSDYQYFSSSPSSWTLSVRALAVDSSGQLYGAPAGYYHLNSTWHGALTRWAPASFYRRPVSGGSWIRQPYPPMPSTNDAPAAVVADHSDNLYAIWGSYATGVLYYYSSASNTWTSKASPDTTLALQHLVWANGKLYAAGTISNGSWRFVRYDPAANSWTTMVNPPITVGAAAAGLSWSWGGTDHIYLLSGDGTSAFARYSLSSNVWETLPATEPWVSFSVSNGPAMARIGSYLYVYAAPSGNSTTNLFRYGSLPASDLRLTVRRTAFVVPDSATTYAWISLVAVEGSYRFRTDIDASNAWVGPVSASWTPSLPTGAARMTSGQAAFAAPQDGVYRLGSGSLLTAGYHRYKAVAHVYASQADCSLCPSEGLVWGETAFARIRDAVESGAARVLVHPGRFPQTFYLVSGVQVIGSGAELTIIEPPAGSAGTLVMAEGVAHASLARLTLAGTADWQGFLAEGGAKGLKLARCIIRDLATGVRQRGGSEVEIANNTILRNTSGLIIEGETPVNVRNTIFAYHTGTGLSHGDSPTSLSKTYNDFWANGLDMNPAGAGLGSLYVDPRFRSLAKNDLRLSERSPLIDRGAPNDPTVPGSGGRVDIGYAEYNTAGFYVSKDYSETSLNDGLSWGIDAFDRIQPALDAAAATMNALKGAVPQGGYSVAVDTGAYTEAVSIPSHVRLIGSGAEVTTLDAGGAGSAVTFNGVIDSQLSGFTVRNTGGLGVEIKGASSGITITRNLIRNSASQGVSLVESSSAQVIFNTIVSSGNAGVYAAGPGSWALASSNILSGNANGMQAASGGLIRNAYNLLNNTNNFSGVQAGEGTLETDPAFSESGLYVPRADSPAIDAADPMATVPAAGGLRADLGYKELVACPLALLFGPQIDFSITGSTGVAQVELGVTRVSDAAQSVVETLPSTWQTLTPSTSGKPLYYWSQSMSQAVPGLYRVYSRATDAAGNLETDVLDWYEGAFVVDNTPPVVTWNTTLPGSTGAAAVLADAQFSGTLTTGAGTRDDVAQAYFSVTRPTGNASYPAEGGQAWIPLPVTGSYTINAVAVDEAGNQALQSATLSVSSTSSVATVTSHVSNNAVNGAALTLRGYVRFTSAGTGSVAVAVSGGATVQASLDEAGAQFSSWTAAITLPSGDGTKTITVTPSLGGTAGTATTLNLVLDTTSPALNVATPAAGARVVQTATFTGTASDDRSGLRRVEVSVDGGYTWRQAAISSGAWSLDWDLGTDLDYVSFPALVRAVDVAGNVAQVERPVTADSAPPAGLAQANFSRPIGQHLDLGATLIFDWNAPVDAGGTAQVLLAVDRLEDTIPATVVSGSSAEFNLDTTGDWYVHLMAQDAMGNQALYHYGPWHVRNLQTASFGDRRESIVLDGNIDLTHDEWQATDLLGVDARSGHPQELYLSLDGQYIFLGWGGAWWTLDGTLWAYLDAASGGASARMDGNALPEGFYADLAVEIRGPEAGSLWSWTGSSWSEGVLNFANGSSGDTEVRVPWPASADQSLNMVAYALPRPPENVEVVQTLAFAGYEGFTLNDDGVMTLSGGGDVVSKAEPTGAPWAVFPTTNGLSEVLNEGYAWSPSDLANPAEINKNQPAARTVYMKVSSPQASNAAICQGRDIVYDILLTNPEPTTISGLTLALSMSSGLSYQGVIGATRTSDWTFDIPNLVAGASTHVIINAQTDANLSDLTEVAVAFNLSAGTTALTPESGATATLTQRVDGQEPVVSIHALSGSAIAAGEHTFTGSASDSDPDGGPGSGLAYVEVSVGGGAWETAAGTLAWSLPLAVTNGAAELTLLARAVDRCGYTGTAERAFIVDRTSPVVNWTAPQAFTSSLTSLSGSTFDPAPAGSLVQRVEVQIDEAGPWYITQGPFAPQKGEQVWNWNWPNTLEDGVTHSLRVRATDAVGNQTVTEPQDTVVDTLAPQLTVSQRLSGEETGPVLSGSVTDGSGIEGVQILVYDAQGGVFTEQASVEGEAWAFTPNLARWSAGIYALRVQATDIYGNIRMVGPYPYEHVGAPAPLLSEISPAAAQAGSGELTLTVTGSSFVSGSMVLWNGQDLTTTVNSDTQLTAIIPDAYLGTVSTNQVTVFTPAPGGGTSNLLAFFVTYAEVQVIGQDVVTGTNPLASTGPASANAVGEGLLVVAEYTGNPGGVVDFVALDTYFDVYAGPGNSFEQVTITTCDLNDGNKLYWWDLAKKTWQQASEQSLEGGCITATVTGTSSPSLDQLQGTYFATGAEALPTVQLSSSQNPSAYGQPLSLTATVSGGYGIPTGNVTFRDGDQGLIDCLEVPLVSGRAACEVPAFAVGTHSLSAEYSGDGVYLPGHGTLDHEVGKAVATLTISDMNYDYDGASKEATVTTEPAELTGVTVTYNGELNLPRDAGNYEVVASLDNPNYQAEDVAATLTIHPLTLIVRADDKGREYLHENPDFTVTYSGFTGGEDEEVLSGIPLLSTSATLDSLAGEYPINVEAGTLVALNYTFEFVPGILTIGPTDQVIYFDPLPDLTYGDADFEVSATASSGLPVSFSAGEYDACAVSGNTVHITRAGSCTVTAAQVGDDNYRSAIPVPQTFTIERANAIIILENLSQEYDGTGKAATVTTAPEGVGVTVTYDGSTELPFQVGSYAVLAEINDPNYQGDPVQDVDLIITSRPITVTAEARSKAYGEADPALTYQITHGSLVAGDSFSGALVRVAGESVGTYAIQQGDLTLGSNYALTYVGANLTIHKATLTVRADDKGRPYSDPNPAFTVTYEGFIDIEGEEILSGSPDCSTDAMLLSQPGDYDITCSTGSLSAENYSFSFVNGTLTIGKEQATITYTGDMQLTTAKAGAKATVTLAATLEEEPDGALGDQMGGQQILFQVFSFGADMNITAPTTSCTAVIGYVSDGKGYGSCTVPLGAGDPYQVKISLVSNDYYQADFEVLVVLVNDPGTGMTTGGGWLVDPNTGGRSNFGFTAKFLKNGKVQGNSLYIYRVRTDLSLLVTGAPGGMREYNWIIKSNAMQGLNIYDCPKGALSGCKATITGKNTVQAVDRLTGVTYSLGGNYQFQVDVTDNREPGAPAASAADRYAMRVWNASGVYYLLGNAYDIHGALVAPHEISGGNIQVKAK